MDEVPAGYAQAVSASPSTVPVDTAVLDIDGTLVDSVYAHVWSWREALRMLGLHVPTWKIHRAIGMGGDRLVEAVTNPAAEASIGDEVRSRQSDLYQQLSAILPPTPGAPELLETLKKRGLRVALASSGSRNDAERALTELEGWGWVDGLVSGDDSDATKPDDEPVRRAVEGVGGDRAFVVGDAAWDMVSAQRAGFPGVGLLTGGIARCELLDAGAVEVYEDPEALTSDLDDLLERLRG